LEVHAPTVVIIDGISSNAERWNGHSDLIFISSIMSIGSKVIRREWWHGHVSLSILFIINEESRLESFKTIVDGLNSHLSHCYG